MPLVFVFGARLLDMWYREELVGSWTWFVSMIVYIAHDIKTYLKLQYVPLSEPATAQ